ncbi:hypothetical protein AN958_00083 [Leucoagaricus sp. SymC.cos]|nr:hypothetical protein AN958_00083 [Leucoagaricus sp. SymC.cos]
MTSSRKALMCAASRKHNHEVFYEAGKTELACLYIYGDKDELILAREVLGYYKGWRNFRSEEVQGGSHLPWSKTNEKAAVMFNEKVLGWIDGIMGVGKNVDGKM